jgi:hypothetical protein
LIAVSAVGAQDDDPVLPDLVVLEDGETITDELDVNNVLHARLYSFDATEGDAVTVTMISMDEDLLDPFLLLFGPSGQLLAADDDSAGGANAQISEYEAPESGNYYALASSYDVILTVFELGSDLVALSDDEEMVEYELTVEGNNDSGEEHQFVTVEVGDSTEIEITEDAPIGYVVFEAVEGDTITLYANSDDVDTLLYLFDATGSLVAVNDDVDFESGEVNSEIADYEVQVDGANLAFVTVVGYDTTLLDEPEIAPGVIEFTVE